MQIFGERLKELRKEKGITTIELAKQLQTSNSIISFFSLSSINNILHYRFFQH